jgi:hypothetical protein
MHSANTESIEREESISFHKACVALLRPHINSLSKVYRLMIALEPVIVLHMAGSTNKQQWF